MYRSQSAHSREWQVYSPPTSRNFKPRRITPERASPTRAKGVSRRAHCSPSLQFSNNMARRQPQCRLRRRYTKEVKCLIMYQTHILGRKPTQISIDLDIPVRVIQRVKKTWKDIGEVCRDRKYMGRGPKMSPSQIEVCQLLDSMPCATLNLVVVHTSVHAGCP